MDRVDGKKIEYYYNVYNTVNCNGDHIDDDDDDDSCVCDHDNSG